MIDVFLSKSEWKEFNDDRLEQYKEEIFNYYRERGFPYYSTNKEYRDKEFNKLISFNDKHLLKDNIIGQTMHGLALAWSYFPHSFNIKCNNKITPFEAFNDDTLFRLTINKRLKHGSYISDSGIRKMLKLVSGVQGVSNFRPTAASVIYDTFSPNGLVWDMSSGWGGRLLGGIKSSIKTYIGTEPSTLTYNGLLEIKKDYGQNKNIQLYNMGSEDFLPQKESLDMCFTSPPYFSLEKYSDEPTQSYIKYSNINDWVNGYLRKTIENCYHGLKKDGLMLINISDPKRKNNNLEQETIRLSTDMEFTLINILKLSMSNPNFKNRTDDFKYEPIFIFKK